MMMHPTYEELNDYADAALSDAAHADMEAHLASCAECSASLDAIRDLQLWAQALPRTMEAPPEVWQEVRAATIDRSAAPVTQLLWQLRYPLAAAAIVLLLVASSVTWYFAQSRQAQQLAHTAPANAQLVAYRQVEAEYKRAANDLLQLLDQRRGTMDTAVVRVVEENLRVMDDAINTARTALLSDPSNQSVAGILAATQESKLKMLRRAIAAPGT